MPRLVKLNEAEVVSKDGYKIRYGRSTLTYFEKRRSVQIPIEHLAAPHEMAIYLDLANGWAKNDRHEVQIDPGDLDMIELRIRECLSFLGRKFSIRR